MVFDKENQQKREQKQNKVIIFTNLDGENIRFVHQILRPAIDEERSQLAIHFGKQWHGYFHLAISLCDGTAARLSAIVEGLRSFEPDMLHMWRLKTLWTHFPYINNIAWNDDIEYLPFHDMETYPAMEVKNLSDKSLIGIVEEMKEWKRKFLKFGISNEESEIYNFWLRKSHQPVLAVLMIKKNDSNENIQYFRGCNMEVSMPTGSLCAERNAIGTALAVDPSLRRNEFAMIAVLALPELNSYNESMNNIDNDNNNINRSYSNNLQCDICSDDTGSVHANFNDEVLECKKKQIVMQRSDSYFKRDDDLNPRGPCGSCEEVCFACLFV